MHSTAAVQPPSPPFKHRTVHCLLSNKFIGHNFSKEQLFVTLGQFHKDKEEFIVVELKFCG